MSKQMKLNIFGIIFFLCIGGTAQAGFVSTAAELELVSFTTVSGDVTLGLDNGFNQVVVSADGDNEEASDASNAFAAIGTIGGFAIASSSSGEVFAATDIDSEGNADAFAEHTINYVAQGSGEVKVTVDYNLIIQSSGVGNQDSELFAAASLFDTGTEVFDEASLSVTGGDDLFLGEPGVLEVLLDIADGDDGTLMFNASSFADLVSAEMSGTGISEVPLPPALVLFVSALVGLTAVGRRQLS